MSKLSAERKKRLENIGKHSMKTLRDQGIETFLSESIENLADIIDRTKNFLHKHINAKVKYTDRDIMMLFVFLKTLKEKNSGK